MKPLATWLSDYSNDHRNLQNQRIHKVCVPLIFATVVGFLHLTPFHIGDAMIALTLIWYAALGLKAFVLMLVQTAIALGFVIVLRSYFSVSATSLTLVTVFALAWIGQFYGHHLEGRRPSFLTDLQYLLIGPIWVWIKR